MAVASGARLAQSLSAGLAWGRRGMVVANLVQVLAMRLPILQAPMAGTSTPAMAAAVSEAGGLGALGLGAATVEAARPSARRRN